MINNPKHPNYATQVNHNVNPVQKHSQAQMRSQLTENFNTVMEQFRNQLLQSFDTNKDGSLDKKEFNTAVKGLSRVTANADKAFESFDTNKDGKVDGAELLKVLNEAAPLLAKQFLTMSHPQNSMPEAKQNHLQNILSSYGHPANKKNHLG